ncbi:hypothetical protein [Photorhabdus heterorhabditis]|uniref:Pili assembly chaperone n=1 Tax=Photorhabdus heterorhabditis TaxID=880156 RepID=A0A5B0WH05_9GAMM|nr:hypothetical protein [Photorhabdus heterorhabditis]KAA1186414.1 pili assembly chaperone [Photorhabdus heterorhabditis]KOY62809.1 pili assembly chaperone [Photorhabdus heterorhabditis]MBS9441181.1 pili assembly chaperone [Photorhabdus heterorhabditis]NRN28995.1 pili assembly chaperone [Photorhabdus heterorhabditis subsp. aluminescens]
MELSLSTNFSTATSSTEKKGWYQSTTAKLMLCLLLSLAVCSMAFAGSDDGALGDIWAYMTESLTGAPGKILAAAMLFSAGYFSVLKPNPGLAVVSFLMMLILANGEKIISGFMDAGVPL